jgi:hypothetical protein
MMGCSYVDMGRKVARPEVLFPFILSENPAIGLSGKSLCWSKISLLG